MSQPDLVLIASADPLSAALLAAALDLTGFDPRFPSTDEPPETALRRLRPALLLAQAEATDDTAVALLGPARMLGARIVLFDTPWARRDLGAVAARYRARTLSLPVDHETLARVLRDALAEPDD